jgi:hypothetical protein
MSARKVESKLKMEKLKETLKKIRDWLSDLSIRPPVPVPVPVNTDRSRGLRPKR